MVSQPVIDAKTANPDADPVIYGLAARRSELAGYIAHLRQQITQAEADLVHLDAVLGMWGVSTPNKAVRVKKATTAGLFHTKELPRLVREALAANPDGLTSRDMAKRISTVKGWGLQDERFQTALADKLTRLMCVWRRKGRVGCKKDGIVSVWVRAD